MSDILPEQRMTAALQSLMQQPGYQNATREQAIAMSLATATAAANAQPSINQEETSSSGLPAAKVYEPGIIDPEIFIL